MTGIVTSERSQIPMSAASNAAACSPSVWPLDRALFAIAGTVTVASAALAAIVSPWFLLLTAFVGFKQWLFVLFGACPTSLILRRAFGLTSSSGSAAQAR